MREAFMASSTEGLRPSIASLLPTAATRQATKLPLPCSQSLHIQAIYPNVTAAFQACQISERHMNGSLAALIISVA